MDTLDDERIRWHVSSGAVMERWQVFASGQVQGVGFRVSAQNYAQALDLTGYAQNLDDGRVKLEVQGLEKDIKTFYERIKSIPPDGTALLLLIQMTVQKGDLDFVIKV